MRGIIDRFEGDYAVVELEGRVTKDISKSELPPEAREGDVVCLFEGQYLIDQEETQRRKSETAKLMENMWE